MLITSSCGIRLVVPPLVPSGGSPLASACLMSPPYVSTLSPRHFIALVLGSVPSPSACLGSASPSSRRSCRPMASRYPPRLIDTTGGAIRRGCGGSLGSACLPPRLAISPVRFGIGWRRDSVLASLDCSCLPRPCPSSVPPATRSLAQSDFLAVLLSCRPIISSPYLPDHSTRGTGRGSLAPLIACLCGSFAIAVRFRLRSICAGSVEDGGGGCLACLGVVLCMLSMG